MATPVRLIVVAAILIASIGVSHAQEQPKNRVLRIGLPFPSYIEHPAPDDEPLALDYLTDIPLATYSEDAGADWRTKGEPVYFNRQRVFPAFSIAEERDGGKTFYAELKPNVFFHDGSIATADDVEFSLKRHLERSPATQRIKFAKRSPSSFTLSSDRPEYWGSVLDISLKKRSGAVRGKSISAGPYIITSVDRGKRKVLLKAFDKYVNGPPLAPEMEYTLYNSSQMAMFGFLADETDFMCGLNRGQERLIGNVPGKQVIQYASQDIYMLTFNTSKPPMDDILVRRAISLLMDRHGLISKSDSLRGGAIPTQYQFAMSAPITRPQAAPPAPAEAFKLLKKAGYTRTAKGWEKAGKPIRLSMQIPSHLSAYIPEARIVSRWLNEAGLDTNFEITPTTEFFDRQVLDKYHILFTAVYDRMEFKDNHALFEPGGRDNISQSTDPDPAIILAGAKSGSLTASDKEAIVRKIADWSYSAPLFYRVDYCAGKSDTGYEDVFFRSPILHSIITKNAPSGSLRSQTRLTESGR